MTFVPDEGGRPRVAYGVGRSVGPAVVRNRVRRRLRAAATEIARSDGLPSGAYLVTVRPAVTQLDYAALRDALAGACREVTGTGSVSTGPAGSAGTSGSTATGSPAATGSPPATGPTRPTESPGRRS